MTVMPVTLRNEPKRVTRPTVLLLFGIPVLLVLLAMAVVVSIAFGAADIDTQTVLDAIFRFDATNTAHLIIQTLRLPRALVAVMVGAALGVTGAIMQGLTRNPLADPALLGIEAGAALFVVAAVYLLEISSLTQYALFAFAGAAVTAALVYSLGSIGRGGATPYKLAIAGAALTALLSSLMIAVLMFDQQTTEEVRAWLVGSVAGREMSLVLQGAPFVFVGLALAFLMGRQITTLTLGDDVAKGLGQNVGWTRAACAAVVVILSGIAVALAGPIGFVGLIIPHAVRFFTGVDYRWILPYSALTGALFLLLADVVGRMIARPTELPVGVMTALIGGPVFILLVRWRVKR
jgi:iron complex transport system permease protein